MPFKAVLYTYRYCYYFIIGRDGEGGKREMKLERERGNSARHETDEVEGDYYYMV